MTDTDCHYDGGKFVPCHGMSAMIASRQISGVGANRLHMMSLENGDESDLGVYFQFTKKAAALVPEMNGKTDLCLNTCPFCSKTILAQIFDAVIDVKDLLRCRICDEPYKEVKDHVYEGNCKHIPKNIRISVG